MSVSQITRTDILQGQSQTHSRQEGCRHCGLECLEDFCCSGCEAIYTTITGLGLSEYYKWRDSKQPYGPNQKGAPEHLIEEFSILEPGVFNGVSTYIFEIFGIHCAGCLWLLEKLARIQPGILSSSLNATTGELTVNYDVNRITLSQIASLLVRLGYPPHSPQAHPESGLSPENTTNLIRIGVSGFAAMNTMMLAVSLFEGLFTGIDNSIASLFRWVSLVLATPTVCWAGIPLYRGALRALRMGQVHIELPLTIAILSAYLLSAYNTFYDRTYVYYDAVCLLIFLLLVSRYVQTRAVDAARRGARLGWSLLPATAKVCNGETISTVRIDQLVLGDLAIVGAGERVPADGILVNGQCVLDRSVLTGEARPESISVGEEVIAGALNLQQEIAIRIRKTGEYSRLGQLLATLRQRETQKAKFTTLTDIVGRWYLRALGMAAVTTIAINFYDPFSALEAILTLFIVTCPCALAFCVPTIYGVTIGEAAARGILVKSARILEDITRVKRIFLDKTGTITAGVYALKTQIWYTEDRSLAVEALCAMTALQPKHPASTCIRTELSLIGTDSRGSGVVSGRGIELSWQGAVWRLGYPEWALDHAYDERQGGVDTTVLFTRDQRIVAKFVLGDTLRKDSEVTIAHLQQQYSSVAILSGDRPATVRAIAERVNITSEMALGGLTPIEKATAIKSFKEPALFVGDGVNDVLAMQSSTVAVALSGGLEATVESADVVVTTGSLASVMELAKAAKRAKILIFCGLAVSLLYNLTAAAITVSGHMNPLIAAFLMPTSSGVVMAMTLLFSPFYTQRR